MYVFVIGVRAAPKNVRCPAGRALPGAHSAAAYPVPARATNPPPANPGI